MEGPKTASRHVCPDVYILETNVPCRYEPPNLLCTVFYLCWVLPFKVDLWPLQRGQCIFRATVYKLKHLPCKVKQAVGKNVDLSDTSWSRIFQNVWWMNPSRICRSGGGGEVHFSCLWKYREREQERGSICGADHFHSSVSVVWRCWQVKHKGRGWDGRDQRRAMLFGQVAPPNKPRGVESYGAFPKSAKCFFFCFFFISSWRHTVLPVEHLHNSHPCESVPACGIKREGVN